MIYDSNGNQLCPAPNGPLNVLDYGFKADGTTDNLAAFNALLTAHPAQTLYFPKGVYAFSGKLVFERCYVELDNAELKCTASTKVDRFIEIRGKVYPPETPQQDMFIRGNGTINANFLADDAIAVARQKHTLLEGISIQNFQRYGVHGRFEDDTLGTNLSYELMVRNCLIETSLEYADAVGIYDTGDSTVTDTVILNVKTALSCSGSSIFHNIHAWCFDFNYSSNDTRQSLFDGTVFASIRENGTRFSDCYCDTYQKGFVLTGSCTLAFISNLMWFINSETWPSDLASYVFCANESSAAAYKVHGAYLKWRDGTRFSNVDLSSQTDCKFYCVKSDVSGTPSTIL